MERLRQRRVKLGVWSVWGRRLRDPGNVRALAGAEGEGQGWEKPWAGGLEVPGEGGGGWGTGCQGPADGSLPRSGLRVEALALGPRPSPLSRQSPPRSAYCPHRRSQGPQRLPTPLQTQTPAGASARPPPARPLIVQRQRRRPLPQPVGAPRLPPHLPGSLQPRTEAAGFLFNPSTVPGEAQSRTPGSLQVRGVNFGLSGSGNQNPRSLRGWDAAVRISWSSKWGMLAVSTLGSQMERWEPKFLNLLDRAVGLLDS